jgi:UDP-2,3-diacylglucosamine hydrolase
MGSTKQVPAWIGQAKRQARDSRAAVFVSDAHIGASWGDPAREETLCAMLEGLPDEIEDVVFGGDLFEFWFEWTHVLPRTGRRLVACIETLARRRRVSLIRGNHDFALGASFEAMGGQVFPDGLVLSVEGSPWLFLHGDGMAPSDRIDRLVRRILRHRACNWAWRHLLHPDLAMAIALGTGRASREIHPGPASNVGEYEAEAFRWMEALELSGVVHGHTHRPLFVQRGGRTYVNNGDWCRMRTRVTIGPGGPQLETFA